MTEPGQIEFHERVDGPEGPPASPAIRSVPVRIGIIAGAAILVVVGAVAAMGASPAPSSSTANPGAIVAPAAPLDGSEPMVGPLGGIGFAFGGGKPGGFRDITITAISGSNLSLETDDGWTRTISVGSATTITKGGQAIAIGDLKVGDQIVFAQSKAADGSYTVTAIRVVMPVLGGQVSAVGSNTITVTQRGGGTGTIHVGSGTTFNVNGNASATLSDITVGSFVVAEGTLRSDGSLDATTVHGGTRGVHGGQGERWFHGPDDQGQPEANPSPTPTPNSSAS